MNELAIMLLVCNCAAASSAQEATPVEVPTRRSSSMEETEATTGTLPRIEVARVKPVDLAPKFRFSDARVALVEGFNLSGLRGIGGTWENT